MKTPLDNFLSDKDRQASDRKQREIGWWETWKNAPDHEKPQHLEPLLKAYDPLLNRTAKEYAGGVASIPQSAIKADLTGHLIKAFEIYDPSKAALSTHVVQRLQKAKRYVGRYQNAMYLPEGQTKYIGKINKAQDLLTEELGRPPTHHEIADHLGVKPKLIETVMKGMRRDIPESRFESDPTPQVNPREQEVLGLLPSVLSHDEKRVFDHLYGLNGVKRIDSTNELAKQLGKSPSQVSRLRSAILNKFNEFK